MMNPILQPPRTNVLICAQTHQTLKALLTKWCAADRKAHHNTRRWERQWRRASWKTTLSITYVLTNWCGASRRARRKTPRWRRRCRQALRKRLPSFRPALIKRWAMYRRAHRNTRRWRRRWRQASSTSTSTTCTSWTCWTRCAQHLHSRPQMLSLIPKTRFPAALPTRKEAAAGARFLSKPLFALAFTWLRTSGKMSACSPYALQISPRVVPCESRLVASSV